MRPHTFALKIFRLQSHAFWLCGAAISLTPFLGCGGGNSAEQPVEAPAPKPRNAADIAQSISGAKVGSLVYADRVRTHPIGPKLAAMQVWQPVLEGTGLDPQKDLERVFIASPSVRSGDRTVAVAQHSLPPERMQAALEQVMAKSDPPGKWLNGEGELKTAQVTVRGQTRAIALIEPSFVVMLPMSQAGLAKRFEGTGGFPDPEGAEAAQLFALEPSRSLKGPYMPRIPETIQTVRGRVILTPDGGADIKTVGKSASPEQAAQDAQALSESVDAATSIKIAIIKIRLFGPVQFRSEGDQVKSDLHLSADDIDRLLGLAQTFMPK